MQLNGHKNLSRIVDAFGNRISLENPVSRNYQPSPRHVWQTRVRDLPLFNFSVIRYMLIDPTVQLCLATRTAPITGLEIGYRTAGGQWEYGVKSDREDVKDFVERQIHQIWQYEISKLMSAQIWGWAAGEVIYKMTRNATTGREQLEFKKFREFHPSDCRSLWHKDQEMVGVELSSWRGTSTRQDGGTIRLAVPGKGYWHAHMPEAGYSDYGTSILKGAYSPFADKWFDGGALDVQRLFMYTEAFSGKRVGYPPGYTNIDGKGEVPNQDIAREIVEHVKSGEVMTFPTAYDDRGNALWKVEDSRTPGVPTHILDYPKQLDVQIMRGMQIPEDILSSAASGAWAGKQVPLLTFWSGVQLWANELMRTVLECVIHPLIKWNWGREVDFEVGIIPFSVQQMKQEKDLQQAGQGGAGGGLGGLLGGMGGDGQQPGGFGGGDGGQGGQPPSPFQQQQMALRAMLPPPPVNPFEAVGRGVWKAAELVSAARTVIGDRPKRLSVNGGVSKQLRILSKKYDATQAEIMRLAAQITRDVTPDAAGRRRTPPDAAVTMCVEPDACPCDPCAEAVKYSRTYFELPPNLACAVKSLVAKIDPNDLIKAGDEPHLTVKYGIHSPDPMPVIEAVRGCGPAMITLGQTDVFESPQQDVVYISVKESNGLNWLNGQLSATCENTDDHPQYIPHVTVAYVKPGTGKKYTGWNDLCGNQLVGSILTFKDAADSNETKIQLVGPMRFGLSTKDSDLQALAKRIADKLVVKGIDLADVIAVLEGDGDNEAVGLALNGRLRSYVRVTLMGKRRKLSDGWHEIRGEGLEQPWLYYSGGKVARRQKNKPYSASSGASANQPQAKTQWNQFLVTGADNNKAAQQKLVAFAAFAKQNGFDLDYVVEGYKDSKSGDIAKEIRSYVDDIVNERFRYVKKPKQAGSPVQDKTMDDRKAKVESAATQVKAILDKAGVTIDDILPHFKALQQDTAEAKQPPAKPPKPNTSNTFQPSSILDAFAELKQQQPDSRYVAVHALRDYVGTHFGEQAASHEVFDKMVHDLRRQGVVRMVPINDIGSATKGEMKKSIPGIDETLFYMEIKKPSVAESERSKPPQAEPARADKPSPAKPASVADASKVDSAHSLFTSIRDNLDKLDSTTMAAQFEPIRNLSMAELKGLSTKLNRSFTGNKTDMLNQLYTILQNHKLTLDNASMIGDTGLRKKVATPVKPAPSSQPSPAATKAVDAVRRIMESIPRQPSTPDDIKRVDESLDRALSGLNAAEMKDVFTRLGGEVLKGMTASDFSANIKYMLHDKFSTPM